MTLTRAGSQFDPIRESAIEGGTRSKEAAKVKRRIFPSGEIATFRKLL
jgi:hypothetical protein